MIRYIERKAIDTEKWDDVIRRSSDSTFYPFSWYLDASAENWSALIEGDYRFIMPLPWKKKFGIYYLYQPLFTQQLGVFGGETVPPDVVSSFLHAIPKRFRMGDLQFNSRNLLGDEEGFDVSDRMNYELMLDRTYQESYADYSENCRRNLRKACMAGLELRNDTGISGIVHFKKEISSVKLADEQYTKAMELFSTLGKQASVKVISAHLDGRLCAAALFGQSGNRAVYLFSASNEAGKEARAMFLIIDQFIRENEESGHKLDFEGSNIPSVARFFAGFGARPVIYQQVSFSRIPVSIRRLRKYGPQR